MLKKMKFVLLVIVVLCLAAVQAEVSGSSMKGLPSATSKSLKKRRELSQSKVESVSVVGAAAKAVAAPAFDVKAATQLAITFSVWYGFNAACKYSCLLRKCLYLV